MIVLGFLGCSSQPQADRRGDVWFEDLAGVAPAVDEELERATRWLRASIFGGDEEPPIDSNDRRPRLMFLSLADESGPAEVLLSGGHGLSEAASNAVLLARERTGARPVRGLKIDFVEQVGRSREVEPRGRVDLERGFDGIAFERSSGLAFLPDEVLAWTLVNSGGEMRAVNIEKYLRRLGSPARGEFERAWPGGRASVRNFTTRSFYVDADRLTRLERGHPRLHRVTANEAWTAALAAGGYLRRNVDAYGRFVYSYLPKTDSEKDEYNMLRHAGTVYSMLELYEASGDRELLAAADRALGFLRSQIEPCRVPDKDRDAPEACVVERGFVKLGGNALAILALLKHAEVVEDSSDLDLIRRLGRWVTGVQEPSGNFARHKHGVATGEAEDFVSEYYPGEALLALVRLHELDPDPAWLDAAEAGARYLISVRDGELTDQELSHDHWLLYALDELYRSRPQRLYLDHALRLARVIVAAQNRAPEFSDWKGSYYRPPRSTPTATRSEGLCATYQLARATKQPDVADEIFEAVRLGVDFQLQTQFGPESVLHLRDPQRALGGFHRSLTDFEIRIDYVQHNLSSLLCLWRALGRGGSA